MAVLDILTYPDSRLQEKAVPVEKVDRPIRTLMDNLLDTLYDVNGVGFAAMQVGVKKRVIVVDLGERDGIPSKPLLMANPTLEWVSPTTQITKEGCFSVPGFYENVTRPLEIKVSYVDENNRPQVLSPSGLLADCIQHEIDHLDGILFIEHLSSLKRSLIIQKLLKGKKNRL